jgi:phage-related protein (TIGR01555 family)
VDKRSLRPVHWYSVDDEERMGEPSHWEVRNFQGMTTTTFVVHESRLVFFGGAQTTARTKRERQWCDLSVLQDKTSILRDIDLVWQRVGRGVAESQVSVLKMKNLDQVMGYSEELTTNRARIVDIDKAMGRTIVLDAELEDYEIISAPNLAGMSEVLQQALQRMSSASRMPVTILLGQSPGGLNATGESDARAWYDQVESYQRDVLAGALAHIMSLIAAQEPELKFGDGDTIHVEFAPLWEATDKEKAEIDKLRIEATLALLAAGVISIEEARERLIK